MYPISIVLSLIFSLCMSPAYADEAPTWIVMVHGTIGAGYAFFHPREISNNQVKDNSLYARQVAQYRQKELATREKLLFNHGLVEIPSGLGSHFLNQKIEPLNEFYGAHLTIGAFDVFAQEASLTNARYFAFGWTGLLSQRHRQQAGLELYHALCNARDAAPVAPRIIIIGYSHGASVAWWVGKAEEQCKRNLSVDVLLTLACPMHVETASLVGSQVFNHVYALQSDGDIVPRMDKLSTIGRKSSGRIHDFVDVKELNTNGKHICDVRIIINNNTKSIDHRSFFNISYKPSISPSFGGLPFLVFVPHILPILINNPTLNDMDIHVNCDDVQQTLVVGWSEYQNKNLTYEPDNLYRTMSHARSLLDYYWAMRLTKISPSITDMVFTTPEIPLLQYLKNMWYGTNNNESRPALA